MTMIENHIANDRCWPVPKAMTRAERTDELVRDAMFREWDWTDEISVADLKEIACEVVHACWRGTVETYKSDEERLLAIKASVRSIIESWAENKVEAE